MLRQLFSGPGCLLRLRLQLQRRARRIRSALARPNKCGQRFQRSRLTGIGNLPLPRQPERNDGVGRVEQHGREDGPVGESAVAGHTGEPV